MPRKTTPAQDASPVADFEQSMQSLEDLVARMESGKNISIKAIARYAKAVGRPINLSILPV